MGKCPRKKKIWEGLFQKWYSTPPHPTLLHPTTPWLKTPALCRNRMKANHTNCRLCKKDVSWTCHSKHFFSVKHTEEFVKPILLAQKDSLKTWRKATKSSACPIVTYDGDKMFSMCFGCKTVRDYLPSYHLSECKFAEEHLATLKRLIGEPEVEEVTTVVSSDEVEKLKAELEKMKKELKAATKKNGTMDGFIKQVLGKRFSDMSYDEMNALMDRKITFIKEEEPEEEYEEEDEAVSFLEAKNGGWQGWWLNEVHYTKEMYLEDKEKCTQTDGGILVWKLSKWYKDDEE